MRYYVISSMLYKFVMDNSLESFSWEMMPNFFKHQFIFKNNWPDIAEISKFSYLSSGTDFFSYRYWMGFPTLNLHHSLFSCSEHLNSLEEWWEASWVDWGMGSVDASEIFHPRISYPRMQISGEKCPHFYFIWKVGDRLLASAGEIELLVLVHWSFFVHNSISGHV